MRLCLFLVFLVVRFANGLMAPVPRSVDLFNGMPHDIRTTGWLLSAQLHLPIRAAIDINLDAKNLNHPLSMGTWETE